MDYPQMQLPIEIVEKIMFYMDSATLLNASKTCKTWNQISKRFLSDNNWWEKSCKIEFNLYEILTVINNLTTEFDWNFIRNCIIRWDNINQWKIRTSKHFPVVSNNEFVSSRILLDKNVFVVRFSYVYFTETELSHYELCTNSIVYAINDLIIDLSGRIIDTTYGRCQLMYPPYEIHRNCAAIDYREEKIIFYASSCVFCLNLKYIQEEMKKETPRLLRSKLLQCIAKNYTSGLILAISYWNSRILLLNNYGVLLTVNENILIKKDTYDFSKYNVEHVFLYCDIVFVITAEGSIVIYHSTNHREYPNVGQILSSHPNLIYLHGNLLFLGLCNGNVLIYHCKNIMDINFENYNHKIKTEPCLVHIEVKEKYEYLHVLLTTTNCVYELQIQDKDLSPNMLKSEEEEEEEDA
ncbi:uncharacterized protein LOC123299320 [Chrysoperla carnea]|uniref:uncharacterized protein LOC123299320 n=1 Tax=Chrysoperla carnea TaxID=189513 RepID=UPI001D078A2C|nr:uncharacterized protein LOC123299320 [Chrysoperla carnea]